MAGTGPLFEGFTFGARTGLRAPEPWKPSPIPRFGGQTGLSPTARLNLDNAFLSAQKTRDMLAIERVQQQAEQESVAAVQDDESWWEFILNSLSKPLEAVKNAAEAVGELVTGDFADAGRAAIRAVGSAIPFSETITELVLPESAERSVEEFLNPESGIGTGFSGNRMFGSDIRARDAAAEIAGLFGQVKTNTDPNGGLFSEFGGGDTAAGTAQGISQDALTIALMGAEMLLDPANWFGGLGVAKNVVQKGGAVASNVARAAGVRAARELPELGAMLKAAGYAEDLSNPFAIRAAAAKKLGLEAVREGTPEYRAALGQIDQLASQADQAVKAGELDILGRPAQQQVALFDDLLGPGHLASQAAREALEIGGPGLKSVVPGQTWGEQALLGQRSSSAGGILGLANRPTHELGGLLTKALNRGDQTVQGMKNTEAFFEGLTRLNETLGGGSKLFKPTSQVLAKWRAQELSDKEAAEALVGMQSIATGLTTQAERRTLTGRVGKFMSDLKTGFRRGFIQDADTAATQYLELLTPQFRENIGAVFDVELRPIIKSIDDSVAAARAKGGFVEQDFMTRVARAVENKGDDVVDEFTDLVNATAASADEAERILLTLQNADNAAIEALQGFDDDVQYLGRLFSQELQQYILATPAARKMVRSFRAQQAGEAATQARTSKKGVLDAEKNLREMLALPEDFPIFERDISKNIRQQAVNAQERILRSRLLNELVNISALKEGGIDAAGVAAKYRKELDTAVQRGRDIGPAIKGAPDKRAVIGKEVTEGLARAGVDEESAIPLIAQWDSLSTNTRSHLNRMVEGARGNAKSAGMAKLANDLTKAKESVLTAVERPAADAAETAFPRAAREGAQGENIGPALEALERLGAALADRGITEINGENVADAVEAILTRGRANQLAPGELGNALDMGIRAAKNVAETRAVGKEIASRLENEALAELEKLGITIEDGVALATKIDALGPDATTAIRPPKVRDVIEGAPTAGTGDSIFKSAIDEIDKLTAERDAAAKLFEQASKGARAAKDAPVVPATARDLAKASERLDAVDAKLAAVVERMMESGDSVDDVLAKVPNDAKAAWIRNRLAKDSSLLTPEQIAAGHTGWRPRDGFVSGLDLYTGAKRDAMLPSNFDDLVRIATTEVPVDVYRDYNRLHQITRSPSFFLKTLDAVNNVWRKFILTTPQSVMNDIAGNFFTAMTIGGMGPVEYKNGIVAYLRHAKDTDGRFANIIKKFAGSGDKVVKTSYGDMKASEIMRKFEDLGLFDIRMQATQRGEADMLAALLPTVPQSKLGKGLRGGASKLRKISNEGFAVRELNDNANRAAKALQAVMQGQTFEEAIRTSRNIFFDFSDVTKMERDVARRLTLFYTWTRKAIPLTLRSMIERPVRFKMMMLMTGAGQNQNNPDMPEWAQRLPGLYLGEDDNGLPKMFALPGAMVNSASDMLEGDVIQNIIRMSNPVLRAGFEKAFDRELFTGDVIGFDEDNRRAALIEGRGADRAPPSLNVLPQFAKDLLGFRSVQKDGEVVGYQMDPRMRWLFENALPFGGIARTADLIVGPLGADERKGALEQLLPLAGGRIRSIPQLKKDQVEINRLRKLRDRIAEDIASYRDQPIIVGRDFEWRPNESSASGAALKEKLDAIQEPAYRLATETLREQGVRSGRELSRRRSEMIANYKIKVVKSMFPGLGEELDVLIRADLAHSMLRDPEEFDARYTRKLGGRDETGGEAALMELLAG